MAGVERHRIGPQAYRGAKRQRVRDEVALIAKWQSMPPGQRRLIWADLTVSQRAVLRDAGVGQ
jgi:predicted Fe-S protein YdhL (DUF1289 family)